MVFAKVSLHGWQMRFLLDCSLCLKCEMNSSFRLFLVWGSSLVTLADKVTALAFLTPKVMNNRVLTTVDQIRSVDMFCVLNSPPGILMLLINYSIWHLFYWSGPLGRPLKEWNWNIIFHRHCSGANCYRFYQVLLGSVILSAPLPK